MRTIGKDLRGPRTLLLLLVSFFLIAQSVEAQITPSPKPTPDSIEKMFGEELNKVRGLDNSEAGIRDHRNLIEALLNRLIVGDENQRYEASVLLQKEAKKDDLVLLADFIREHATDRELKIPIVKALGETKNPQALQILTFEFNQGDIPMQLAILDALAKIPEPAVVNILQDILLTGDNIDVHIRAAASLGKIGGDRAIYVLNAVAGQAKNNAVKVAIDWALRYATGSIPQNKTDIDLEEGRQQNYFYEGKQYYAFRPAFRKDAPKDSWLIVCIHGKDLNYTEVIDLCQPMAKQLKSSLLVPFFDPINFPDFESFNLSGARSDRHLLDLLAHMGERAEVKTSEMYLIGFGRGGDFAQRLTYFYPDKIARAAFNSTFFYPLEVKSYFPDGLKTTPLAPDLKVDFLKVIKTDFAFILNPNQANSKDYKQFISSIQQYTSKSGRSSRIRVRQMSEKGASAAETFNLGRAFLFPPQ